MIYYWIIKITNFVKIKLIVYNFLFNLILILAYFWF